tara:strand:+ start:2266 stop:6363 length:4098 start_codon:yes stop_codon:yes gene_type:complete
MVNYPTPPNPEDLIKKLLNQSQPNRDVLNHMGDYQSRLAALQAKKNAKEFLYGNNPQSVINVQDELRSRNASLSDLQTTLPEPPIETDDGWFDNGAWGFISKALEYPAKHVARPAMGVALSNIFGLVPGEQAGEKELREAGARNPLAMIFQPERRGKVREALKETDLPFGVYTAMELALDPLNFIPVGYVAKGLKVGGKLGGALDVLPTVAKAPKATVGKVRPLGRLMDIEQRMDLMMHPNAMREIGERLEKIPAVGSVVTYMNPTVASKSEVGKILNAYETLVSDGANIGKVGISPLISQGVPFTFVNAPVPTATAKKLLKEGVIDEEVSRSVGGFVQGIKGLDGKPIHYLDLGQQYRLPQIWKQLNKDQQKFLTTTTDILQDGAAMIEEAGINITEVGLRKGEVWFPRNVLSSLEDALRLRSNSGKTLGSKESFLHERIYQSAIEGVENLTDYLVDPLASVAIFLRGVTRTVADKKLVDILKTKGYALNNADNTHNFLIDAAITARRDVDRLESMKQIIRNVTEGATLKPGTRVAIIKRFGHLGKRLDDVLKETNDELRTSALNKLNDDVFAQIPDARRILKEAGDKVKEDLPLMRSEKRRLASTPAFGGMEFVPEIANEIDEFFYKQSNDFMNKLGDINDIGRMALTGFDLGAGMIQGFLTMMRYPATWARGQKLAAQALFDPVALDKVKTANALDFQEMARIGISISDAEQVAGGMAQYGERAGILRRNKIPVVSDLAERASRAFNGFGDYIRWELYRALKPVALRKAQQSSVNPDQYLHEMASVINKMTGVLPNASIGIRGGQAAVERTFLFASRYYRGSFGLLADIFQGGIRGSEARKAIFSLLTAGSVMHYIQATALGQEPKFDPRDKKFMSVEIAGQDVGFGPIWLQMMRTGAKVYHQTIEDENPEKLLSLDSSDNPLAGFARGRLSPSLSYGLDLFTGRDFIGRPVRPGFSSEQGLNFGMGLARRLTPIWAQDVVDYMGPDIVANENPASLLLTIPAEASGMRVIPHFILDKVKSRRDTVANTLFGKEWDQLEPVQHKFIREGNGTYPGDPTLVGLETQLRAHGLDGEEDIYLRISQYVNEKEKARDEYDTDARKLSEGFEAGKVSPRNFRESLSALGHTLGVAYSTIDNQEIYQPVLGHFAEQAQRDKKEPQMIEEIFADMWFSRISLGPDEVDNNTGETFSLHDEYGQYNHEERQRRILDIKDRLQKQLASAGKSESFQEIWNKVIMRVDSNKSRLSQSIRQLTEGQELFRIYWEVGNQIAEQQGPEVVQLWNQYKKNQTSSQAEQMLKQNPILQRIQKAQTSTRQAMRDESPALDAWLYKFGYTTTLRNKQNQKLGKAVIESGDFDPFMLSID